MTTQTEIDDLLAWRALREEGAAPGVKTHLDERIEDLLRLPAVAAAFREAAGSPAGTGGESGRRRFRLVAEGYLDLSSRDRDGEIARALSESGHDPATLHASVMLAVKREERHARLGLWSALEEKLAPLRHNRREARLLAAKEAGAEDLLDFHGASHPVPPGNSLEEYERGAIAPLDERIAAHSLERRTQFVPPVLLAPDTLRRVLRGLSAGIGLDPDAGRGPAIGTAPDPSPWSRVLETREVPLVLPGTLHTPSGLAASLGAFGRAVRVWSLGRAHGLDASLAADPGFAQAATLLFRRLVLSSRFREWAGLSLAEPAAADLRFEEALGPRLAWGLLRLAVDRATGDTSHVRAVLLRATGRAAGPDLLAATWESDPQGAAILRGSAFAALLEERVLLRLGRGWFGDPRSLRVLREAWEAEPGETLESLAGALDLGTMEAQAVADAYRP